MQPLPLGISRRRFSVDHAVRAGESVGGVCFQIVLRVGVRTETARVSKVEDLGG